MAQEAISEYPKIFKEKWLSGMRAKLGLFNEEDDDEVLIDKLLSIMDRYAVDFTNTFRALTIGKVEDTGLLGKEEFDVWYQRWNQRLTRQKESREEISKLMKNNNPSIIPRNHRVEEALAAAVKNSDYTIMDKLLAVLKNPYDYSKEQEEYVSLPKQSKVPYKTFCGT